MTHDLARKLRRNNTNAERRLWIALRNRRLGRYKFRRQQPIGFYIADFVCFEQKLVVELDGEHHDQPETIATDSARTSWLESRGYRVLRFWNRDLDVSAESVIEAIFRVARG